MKQNRSRSEIRASLDERRRAVASDFRALLSRAMGPTTTFRHPVLRAPMEGVPVWSIAAGAAIGALFMKRPLWPLQIAGRMVGIAAPIVIPLLASRLRQSSSDEGK